MQVRSDKHTNCSGAHVSPGPLVAEETRKNNKLLKSRKVSHFGASSGNKWNCKNNTSFPNGSSGLTYGSSSHLSCLDSHYLHRNATASGHIGRSDI